MPIPYERLEITETLVTPSGDEFEVEVSGATHASALIMVHGFGVKRDARSLFTDIALLTAPDMLSVRADFSAPLGDSTQAIPFSEQVDRLQSLVHFCRSRLSTDEEVLIAHSQGWVPIALSGVEGRDILALAPPLGTGFEEFIAMPGWSRHGSVLNLDSVSKLIRSDGSSTLIPKTFWDEFRDLDNLDDLFGHMALNNQVKVIFAGEDNILGEQVAPPHTDTSVITAADHDFTGQARQPLLEEISRYLNL